MHLTTPDFVVVAIYAVALFSIAWWVSREPEGHSKTTEDYFLAGRALPWWAIGASLIAANISAEQIIGMSGEGYRIGLAIAAYEWQAALILIIVAVFFLPIFLKREIYTMPQFLEQRFGNTVKVTMSVYWLALYTFVNLAAVLWLGSLAVNSLTGLPYFWGMAALAAFAYAYSVYGGLKAVALTDIIQVVLLISGGLFIAYLTLGMIGGETGVIGGFNRLVTELPAKFELIFEPSDTGYATLPGIWTLLGGMWILHFSYWGFNQYIIQRALGAKDLPEAQKGLVFAAALKVIMPLVVVLPGIAAAMLAAPEFAKIDPAILDGTVCTGVAGAETCGKSDRAYAEVMKLVPSGVRGLIFAALIAAIVSSLASMMNSIATIFTMDIYEDARPERPEKHYVMVGRITALAAIALALLVAQPLLGSLESAFQFIQKYTGFIAPGIVAVFLMGMFWRRTTEAGAMAVILGSLVYSIIGDAVMPSAFPFVITIIVVFLACLLTGAVVSVFTPAPSSEQPVDLDGIDFSTTSTFKVAALLVIMALVAIYAAYW